MILSVPVLPAIIIAVGVFYVILFRFWRRAVNEDRLYEQRRQIKNQFEETSYQVEVPPGAEIIAHTIHVANIDCIKGKTTVSFSFTQRFHPVTYPDSAILPDIEDELRQSEWYEDSEIYIAPPSRGELVIEIPTTEPPEVASWIETIIDEMKPLLQERDSINKLTTDNNDTTDLDRPESH